MKRISLALSAATLLLSPVLSGCGGDGSDGGAAPAGPGTTARMIEYEFVPRNLSVRSGTELRVNNAGQIAHNLTIERGPNPRRQSEELAGTSTFLPGRSERLKVDLQPGRYVMACTVPGHRELGMVGTITVR